MAQRKEQRSYCKKVFSKQSKNTFACKSNATLLFLQKLLADAAGEKQLVRMCVCMCVWQGEWGAEDRVLLELVQQTRVKDCFDPQQLADEPLRML